MIAAIYCRVSTEDQEREGTSLDSQRQACLNKAHELGFVTSDKYITMETFSGLTLDRPQLLKLREWIRENEVNAIVSYTIDRLSRDPVHFIILQEEMEKAGCELILVTEDIDNSDMGRLITYIKGFAAKLETEKIKERTMRGKRERVKAGRLPGGRFTKLYGYNYVKGKGVGEGVRYISDKESKVVQEIYRLYTEEQTSLYEITRRLNTLDIPSPSGKCHWNRTGVHYILTNPAYTGRTFLFTRYKVEAKRHLKASRKNKLTHSIMKPREEWVELKGATPALVSEDLFNQVQEKLKRNKELALRNTKKEYLLSGYVFCGNCGRRFSARSRGKYSYYSCPKCRNRNMNSDYLESSIWSSVKEALSKPEAVLTGVEMMRNEAISENLCQKELDGIVVKLRHMTKEKDRTWKAFEITGDEAKFTCEIKSITLKMGEFERRKAELENKIEQIGKVEINMESIKKYCELARNNIGSLSFSEKRLVLESLGARVIVSKEDVTLQGMIPIVSSQSA